MGDDLDKVQFFPPLYQQRYLKTISIIEEYYSNSPSTKLTKVIDIGCSDLSFFKYLRRVNSITEVVLLDLDCELLNRYSRRIDPFPIDYVLRRQNPLSVFIVGGDATTFHRILMKADIITMIEFIEHLYEERLPSLVATIFGMVKPKLVIITTPNSDYNKYFPNWTEGKFRHPDHKFEYTGYEFQKWCGDIIRTYPSYNLEFTGCGEGKDGTFCSQIAIFLAKNPLEVGLNEDNLSLSLATLKMEESIGDRSIDPWCGKGPCLGCTNAFSEARNCNIIYSVQYPYDTRTPQQRNMDKIITLLYELRAWIKSHLEIWNLQDYYEVFYNYPYDSNRLAPQQGCIAERSMDTEDRHTENKFIFDCIYNMYNLAELVARPDIHNVFLYVETQDLVVFSISTFSNWANVSTNEETIIEALSTMMDLKIGDIGMHRLLFVLLEDNPDLETEMPSLLPNVRFL